MSQFDSIAISKGMVRVLQPLLDNYLGRLKYEDSSGTWVDSDQPAIYLSYPDENAQSFPRVLITANGSSDLSVTPWQGGVQEVDDPDNIGQSISVPYLSVYKVYTLTLTVDSGSNDEVLRGERLSAETILNKIKTLLFFDSVRESISTEMESTLQDSSAITPTYTLGDVEYYNSANMTLTFNFIDTIYDYDGSYFNAVEHDGTISNSADDQDPLTFHKQIGPV